MRRYRLPRRRAQRGQILVETAIVMPILVFTILGAVQLVLLQHAQVMTEYAAYNAVRAGIVHNANWNIMRNAATLAALPLYERTDRIEHFLLAWGKVKVLNELTELVDKTGGTVETVVDDLLGVNVASSFLPDVSLVEVEVRSPVVPDFDTGFAWQQGREERAWQIDGDTGALDYPDDELDFDEREMIAENPRLGRLAAETRVLVPLRIPLVNWIFFQLWYAQQELQVRSVRGNLQDWARQQGRLASGETLEEAVRDREGQGVFEDAFITRQRSKEARMLRELAVRRDVYLIPLRASYAMQMQSNPFFDNRREPVWFEID